MPDAPTFNPARRLATRVLASVLDGSQFAAPALDAALNRAALSTRDAGLATHVVYGTLRHAIRLEAALTPLLRGPTQPKVRALLLAGAFEKLVLGTPSHAVVNEYVNLAKTDYGRMSGLVNAVLRRVGPPEPTPETQYSLPTWLIRDIERAYRDAAADVMLDFLEPAPLWLWLPDEGIRLLEEAGAVVDPGHGDVFRVVLPRPLRETEAFRQGAAQPINPASIAAVEALGAVRERHVLDLAGGAGVKAAMLAVRGARVTSVDIDARKHRSARENLRRLGVDAEFRQADLRANPDLSPADLVLLDAPCTGTGTLRAHPEIKLRVTPEAVTEMSALQATMLDTAATLVRPGGLLVYSVCAIGDAEGPDVVRSFLERHADFTPDDLDVSVPTVPAGHGVRTLATGGVDGFFLSRLRRTVP